jgi:hypothetical protein
MKPAKYFFSYSRVDSDFAKKLATDLRNAGADVWIDQLDIVPGSAWDVAIQNALNEAGGVLAIISDTSIQSKNVMDEVSYAISQEKRIIPLILESCPIPFRLARLQHVDFTKDYDSALEYLLKALKASATNAIAAQPVISSKAGTSAGKSLRTTILLSAAIIAASILTIFFLVNKNKSREVVNNDSMISHEAGNTDSTGDRGDGDVNGRTAALTNTTNTNDRVNLFASENGGRILIASSDDWKYTIDGSETLAQISYGLGKEAVYGFKDERPATFDLFTMLINGTETYNIKEFELFAGNDSPTGPFKSIGKFQTQNVKLFKTPYQEFKFAPVTAKYVKFKLISTYDWPHPNIFEFQLFGNLK